MGPKWNTEDDDPSTVTFTCVGCFEPIKILHYKCPNCFWPACSSACIGLTNPELHDIECGLLKIGKGPVNRTDIRSIKDYFRSDALIALKILLLQRKNPRKFKALMEMESNDKNRLMTYNFKEAEERINYLEDNFLSGLKKAEEKSGQVILHSKTRKFCTKYLASSKPTPCTSAFRLELRSVDFIQLAAWCSIHVSPTVDTASTWRTGSRLWFKPPVKSKLVSSWQLRIRTCFGRPSFVLSTWRMQSTLHAHVTDAKIHRS